MVNTNMKVHVHVLEKTIIVSCGVGTQRIRWLGNVAIARYDEDNYEGWRTLGVPTKVVKILNNNKNGSSGRGEKGGGKSSGGDDDSEEKVLNLDETVKDLLKDGDEVRVESSVDPEDSVVTAGAS
jgi:hypothetical protein